MKEVKKFYSNDKLNKGYKEKTTREVVNNKISQREFSRNLPPADIIEIYEEMYPGILKKIISIAENEQKIKSNTDKILAASSEKARRMGNFFAILVVVIICYTILKLSEKDLTTSLIFSLISFGSISLISYFQYKIYCNKNFKRSENLGSLNNKL